MKTLKLICTIIMNVALQSASWAQIENLSLIGGIINNDTAKIWTDRYQASSKGSIGQLFAKKTIIDIIEPSHVAGVYIMKGINENEQEQLIIYRTDNHGLIIDKNFTEALQKKSGSNLSCIEMISNYQAKYPKATYAQLYGKGIFRTLLTSSGVEALYILNALDSKKQEHFVLVGTTRDGNLNLIMPTKPLGDGGVPSPPYYVDYRDLLSETQK